MDGLRTQAYRIMIGGVVKDAKGKPTGKRIAEDVTDYVSGEVTLTDEDGSIKTLSFALEDVYTKDFFLGDALSIGQEVTFYGGTLEYMPLLFSGEIKELGMSFPDDGACIIGISALSKEWKHASQKLKDLWYPSKNSPYSWAKNSPLKASDIIKNIVDELNNGEEKDGKSITPTVSIKLGKIDIKHDVTYTFAKPVRQSKTTDYRFLQDLGKKISCVVWFSMTENNLLLNCVDEKSLVDTLANYVFFYPRRKGSDFTITEVNDNMIQLSSVAVNIDTGKGTGKNVSSTTDPETGEEKMVVQGENEDGTPSDSMYELDEAKLAAESEETRDRLMNMYTSGELGWDEVKKYFREVRPEGTASRAAVAASVKIQKLGDKTSADGMTTTDATTAAEEPLEKSYALNSEALGKLGAEEQSALMGRAAMGILSDAEYAQFFTESTVKKEDETITPEKNVGNKDDESTSSGGGKKKRRDEGFNITGTCNGNPYLKTKLSYVIQGLGRYSGKYYLYKLEHSWGSDYLTKITLTR